MKNSKLSKLLGAGALAIGLATLPTVLPASAQSSGSDTGSSTSAPSTQTTENNRDDSPDLGWLGLLGLAGLAGLRRKPDTAAYRDPAYQDPNVEVRR